MLEAAKRSDIDSRILIASVPEPRSPGNVRALRPTASGPAMQSEQPFGEKYDCQCGSRKRISRSEKRLPMRLAEADKQI
jgi:hypothetical protein